MSSYKDLSPSISLPLWVNQFRFPMPLMNINGYQEVEPESL
jgi:hypothetical protein